MSLHPQLRLVFNFFEGKFPDEPVAIIGSAVRDYDHANDIDVLLPHSIDWAQAMQILGTKYSGWNTAHQGHVRRANVTVPRVEKKVQVLQISSEPTPDLHPNAALLGDGTVLKLGNYFDKAAFNARKATVKA